MNRRELYRQMRAAEVAVLPPTVDDIGMVRLLGKLWAGLNRGAIRVGLVAGVAVGSLVFAGTALLDGAVLAPPGHALLTWFVLVVVHAVLGALVGAAGALPFMVWMLLRGQLRHRRYNTAVFAGMIAGVCAVALGYVAWFDMGAVAGAPLQASPGSVLMLVGVIIAGVWVGRSVLAVIGVWRTRGLQPPLAPVRRQMNAVWRGVALVAVGAVVAWDMIDAHVAAPPRRDEPVAETLSLQTDRHVLILGIDGLGWDAVRTGIGDGSLENWDSLERSGARGRLHSTTGHGPAAFWTTVATGVTQQRHGVRSLVQPRVAGTGRPLALAREHTGFHQIYGELLRRSGLSVPVPVSRYSIRRWCAWEVVRQAGGEAGVVGWWGAWPGEGESGTLDMSALGQGAWHADDPLALDVRVGEGLRAILHRSVRPSLTLAYLPGLDLLHRAGGADPESAQEEAHRRFLDALIGEAAAWLGPDDLLIVVGDPGGRRPDAPVFGAARLETGGVMLAIGSGIEPATRLSRPAPEDVWPTAAWWLGLPPSLAWDGQAWLQLRPGEDVAPAIASYGRPARRERLEYAPAAMRMRQLRDAGYVN